MYMKQIHTMGITCVFYFIESKFKRYPKVMKYYKIHFITFDIEVIKISEYTIEEKLRFNLK